MSPHLDSASCSRTRLTDLLDLQYPIIQGPFGGGLSSVELVKIVSNAGGLGSFGAVDLWPQEIESLVHSLQGVTSKPFAVNLWVTDSDPGGETLDRAEYDRQMTRLKPFYDELGVSLPEFSPNQLPAFEDQIEALMEARPPVFSFVFGVPSSRILQACRERGIRTLGTATTVQEARALEAAGVDGIVVSGAEAGGHRASFLRSAEESLTGTFALVQLAAAAVRVPIVAAGGIATGRGIKAALTLGASGVQIGTAFLACEESGASNLHRTQLFSPAAAETGLTRAFTGRLARGLRNRYMDEIPGTRGDIAAYPQQGCLTSPLRRAALEQGRADFMA